MLRWLYIIIAAALIGGYAYAGLRGLEFRQTKKGFAPQSVRGKQGGSRSFWYSGYRGGK